MVLIFFRQQNTLAPIFEGKLESLRTYLADECLCFSFGIDANIRAMCMPSIVRVRRSSLPWGRRTALKIPCISAELGMMWTASDDRGNATVWD